jgi:serine/threonine protein kinase
MYHGHQGEKRTPGTSSLSAAHLLRRIATFLGEGSNCNLVHCNLKFHLIKRLICRYEVVKSLGVGVYGTVLECYDRKHKCSVAIKICKALPAYLHAARQEIKVLRDLGGCNGTLALLRHFEHDSHICMSFDLLGESLKAIIDRFLKNTFFSMQAS